MLQHDSNPVAAPWKHIAVTIGRAKTWGHWPHGPMPRHSNQGLVLTDLQAKALTGLCVAGVLPIQPRAGSRKVLCLHITPLLSAGVTARCRQGVITEVERGNTLTNP